MRKCKYRRRQRPAHCGQPAFDVTLAEDLAAGARRWLCSWCGRELRPKAARAPRPKATEATAQKAG
jgi:hypothetical protein